MQGCSNYLLSIYLRPLCFALQTNALVLCLGKALLPKWRNVAKQPDYASVATKSSTMGAPQKRPWPFLKDNLFGPPAPGLLDKFTGVPI